MVDVAKVVSDPRLAQTCSLAGLATMKDRWITLNHIAKAMDINIREAEGAENQADIVRFILFGLRLTKASCDAVVDILGTAVPAGEGVKTAYSGVKPFAEEFGKFTVGESSAGGWTKAANAGAMAVAQSAAGSSYTDLIKLQKIKSDLVIDAANQDIEAVIKDLGEYSLKVTTMSLKLVGKKTWGKVVDIGKALVKAGKEYATSYQEFRENDMDLEGAKRVFRTRQKNVQLALTALEAAILDCEFQLAGEQSAYR